MAVLYEDTQTIGSTEFSLTNSSTSIATKTDVGPIFVFIDTAAMANGDEYVVTVYEKARSATTQRVVMRKYLSGAQSEPLLALPALRLRYGWDVTMDKLAGTDRSFPYRIEN